MRKLKSKDEIDKSIIYGEEFFINDVKYLMCAQGKAVRIIEEDELESLKWDTSNPVLH